MSTTRSKSKRTAASQQEYLRRAKAALALTWDQFAEQAMIAPRALKTYRLPNSSKHIRKLPRLARASIDRLLEASASATEIQP